MPDNEKIDRFKRLAPKRTNAVLKKLDILSNCADRGRYEYTEEEIDKIFGAIKRRVKKVQSKFESSEEEEKFTL